MAWESPAAFQSVAGGQDVANTQRVFMARVYRWMLVGLAVTGAVAWYTAVTPWLLQAVLPLMLPLVIGDLLVVLALSALSTRLGGAAAALLFLAYSVLNGLTFSTLFLVYELGSIGETFLLTAGVFGAMSLYATVTKKDLIGWRSFLLMGLVGVLAAGVVNLFVRSSMLGFMVSCASVVVFTGLTAYDTQKLRGLHASTGYSAAGSLAIIGALTLYLDFVNLFLALLRLFGRRR